MNRTIECLKIKGYKYNPDIGSETHSAFYDKDDDTHIEVLENYKPRDLITIIYCYKGINLRVVGFFMQGDSCWWEEHLEKFIEYNMPEEMK